MIRPAVARADFLKSIEHCTNASRLYTVQMTQRTIVIAARLACRLVLLVYCDDTRGVKLVCFASCLSKIIIVLVT